MIKRKYLRWMKPPAAFGAGYLPIPGQQQIFRENEDKQG
jgi:hypothetical protein